MSINVTVRPGYQPPQPPREPDDVVVEMSREDAQALAAVAYGVSGPARPVQGSNSRGLLSVNLYPSVAFLGTAENLRDRLRNIGNTIAWAL